MIPEIQTRGDYHKCVEFREIITPNRVIEDIRPLAKIRKYPETICVNRCLSARYLRLLYDSKIFARGLV
jgi:hypothetical protein